MLEMALPRKYRSIASGFAELFQNVVQRVDAGGQAALVELL